MGTINSTYLIINIFTNLTHIAYNPRDLKKNLLITPVFINKIERLIL